MSTTVRTNYVADSPDSVPGVDPGALPTIKGLDGALEYVRMVLKVRAVGPTLIRRHTEQRKLKVFIIANAYWFAPADLLDWIMSLRAGGAK